jgi:hypothetical protein
MRRHVCVGGREEGGFGWGEGPCGRGVGVGVVGRSGEGVGLWWAAVVRRGEGCGPRVGGGVGGGVG